MDDAWDTMVAPVVASVRLDTASFARDVASLRDTLEGPLSAGADRAGRVIETSLLRAVRSGKLGFEDLKSVALAAMAEIAAAALRAGIEAALAGSSSGGGGSGGGDAQMAAALASLLSGSPGRATGGPVSPGRAYRVGERGPELFVPTASGRVEAGGSGSAREVRVAITVNAPVGAAPGAMQQSSRQVARAVRAALTG